MCAPVRPAAPRRFAGAVVAVAAAAPVLWVGSAAPRLLVPLGQVLCVAGFALVTVIVASMVSNARAARASTPIRVRLAPAQASPDPAAVPVAVHVYQPAGRRAVTNRRALPAPRTMLPALRLALLGGTGERLVRGRPVPARVGLARPVPVHHRRRADLPDVPPPPPALDRGRDQSPGRDPSMPDL